MALKKLLIPFAILILSSNLIANENIKMEHPTEICDRNYSICMQDCDEIDNLQEKEACYDKCDEQFDSCMNRIQSE